MFRSQCNDFVTIHLCISEHSLMLLKIFIVMGVTYFFEFVGFTLSWIYGKDKVWKYLVVNNIVNALQGVLIFAVLICKRSILQKMSNRWVNLKRISLSEKVSLRPHSKTSKRSNNSSDGDIKIGSSNPTDVIILCGVSGKYSTSSMLSTATTATNVSST